MSADLWMGIAIGSLTPWALVILLVRRNKQDVDKAITGGKTATELLAKRNEIGRLQVSALMEIQHRLEGIYDRMPEMQKEESSTWQPIDSFRGEDKRAVIVFCDGYKNQYTAYREDGIWYHFAAGLARLAEMPSFWRPLEKPPTGKEGA